MSNDTVKVCVSNGHGGFVMEHIPRSTFEARQAEALAGAARILGDPRTSADLAASIQRFRAKYFTGTVGRGGK